MERSIRCIRRADTIVGLAVALGALALYSATLLPGVGRGDTAEFQRVAPTLGVAHPTGYPLYTILGWLWNHVPLGGTPAWRMNLFSAAAGALTVGALYAAARALGQARVVAAAAALALAVSRTFWSQATVAEVYALAALIQALLILALLRWRAGRNPDAERSWPLWAAGLLVGLGLAHHRTIVLMLPGLLLFVGLEARGLRLAIANKTQASSLKSQASCVGLAIANKTQASSLKSQASCAGLEIANETQASSLKSQTSCAGLEIANETQASSLKSQASSLKSQASCAALAVLACCLLYLYLPLRAPGWIDSWRAFAQYVAGSSALSVWLTPDPPWRVAWEHIQELALRFIWPQFFPIGALLALLGALRLWRRDRAAAALLVSSYLLVVLFCALFFVQDVEVFLISAHLIAALLLGEGAMLCVSVTKDERRKTKGERRKGLGILGPWSSILGSRFSVLRPWSFIFGPSSLVGIALLLLPALLLFRNLGPIRAGNTAANEAVARSILAQPLPRRALLIVDWEAVEGLRYLQAIEGMRPDIEVRPLNADVARQDAEAALAAGRAAYLLRPRPELGLAQAPEGRLWRVSDRPIDLHAVTPADQRWRDGITLKGYTLPRGPYQPGDVVPLTLDWLAQAAPQQRYTMFVHIVGADGSVWGQQDREPARAPTDQWRPGERLVDVYGPALSLETPPGRYRVLIGWYAYPSLARVPLESGAADTYAIGEIEVVAPR